MKRTLFLSATGMIGNLATGKHTQAQLHTGMFAFGCTRTRFFDPSYYIDCNGVKWCATNHTALELAWEELRIAEHSDPVRVCWRIDRHTLSPLQRACLVLQWNGYGPGPHTSEDLSIYELGTLLMNYYPGLEVYPHG